MSAHDTPRISVQQRSLGDAIVHAVSEERATRTSNTRRYGRTSGTDDGRRVLVIDRCTGALATLAFVLGVVTIVVAGFGAVALATAMPSRVLGAIFLAVGLVFALLTFLAVRKIRQRRSQPLHQCRPVAVIDRKLGLFSYRGGALVQLDQVRFARQMQIGSSSPQLVATHAGWKARPQARQPVRRGYRQRRRDSECGSPRSLNPRNVCRCNGRPTVADV